MNEIALVEPRQARVHAVNAWLHSVAQQEHLRRRPVVSTEAAILLHSPAKLGESAGEHAVSQLVPHQILLERRQRRGQLIHQPIVSPSLIRMCVETTQRDIEYLYPQIPSDQLCDSLQPLTKPVLGILSRWLVLRGHFLQSPRAAVGRQRRAPQELQLRACCRSLVRQRFNHRPSFLSAWSLAELKFVILQTAHHGHIKLSRDQRQRQPFHPQRHCRQSA